MEWTPTSEPSVRDIGPCELGKGPVRVDLLTKSVSDFTMTDLKSWFGTDSVFTRKNGS